MKGYFVFDKIKLEDYLRIFRLGFGKNYQTYFIRLDLWGTGYRLSYGPER